MDKVMNKWAALLGAGDDVLNRGHSLMSKLVKTAFRTASTELAGAFA